MEIIDYSKSEPELPERTEVAAKAFWMVLMTACLVKLILKTTLHSSSSLQLMALAIYGFNIQLQVCTID